MKPARTQSREEDEVSKLAEEGKRKKKKTKIAQIKSTTRRAGKVIESHVCPVFRLPTLPLAGLAKRSAVPTGCDPSLRRHNPDTL